jgi:hypothetical protein
MRLARIRLARNRWLIAANNSTVANVTRNTHILICAFSGRCAPLKNFGSLLVQSG